MTRGELIGLVRETIVAISVAIEDAVGAERAARLVALRDRNLRWLADLEAGRS